MRNRSWHRRKLKNNKQKQKSCADGVRTSTDSMGRLQDTVSAVKIRPAQSLRKRLFDLCFCQGRSSSQNKAFKLTIAFFDRTAY